MTRRYRKTSGSITLALGLFLGIPIGLFIYFMMVRPQTPSLVAKHDVTMKNDEVWEVERDSEGQAINVKVTRVVRNYA